MKLISFVSITFVVILLFLFKGDIIQSKVIEKSGQPGKIMLKIDMPQAPIEVTMIRGFLERTKYDTVFFQFEMQDDVGTAIVENVSVGEWHLQVDAYNTDGIVIYSGSQFVHVLPGVITPVNLPLNPSTGGLEIKVTWDTESIYFEGFEHSMAFNSFQLVNGNSYIKVGRDGWKVYAEAFYDARDVATSWDWVTQDNYQNESKSIRGTTSVEEMGILWLFKSIPVMSGGQLIATVQARTRKVHNGGDTGPCLYLFDGIVDYPSTNLNNILDWDEFTWGTSEWSPWKVLKTTCYPSQDYITVGFRVKDAWDSYAIYHEYDSFHMYYSY